MLNLRVLTYQQEIEQKSETNLNFLLQGITHFMSKLEYSYLGYKN